MATIQNQKRALRKTVSLALRKLSTAEIQSQCRLQHCDDWQGFDTHIIDTALAVAKAVLSLPVFERSKHVSCYLSMPTGELDTNLLVKEVLRAGNIRYLIKPTPTLPMSSLYR
jgi:5-formyltetrahydrofolate cyclo-ligase